MGKTITIQRLVDYRIDKRHSWYSHINDANYDGSDLTSVMDDVKASGAVFVASIMPSGVTWSEIDDNLAAKIGSAVKQYTDNGITVWLRFAHEVNYYVTPNSGDNGGPEYPGGAVSDYQTAWQRVHAQCAAISNCLMFWSPNRDSLDNIAPYWPGPDYVDIVGIDCEFLSACLLEHG